MDFLLSSWPLLLAIPVFYFFIIRPQSQKQKKQDTFEQDLKKGDEVVTNSGIIGRINKFEDRSVQLQVDSKSFIKVLRNSISRELTTEYTKVEESK